MFAVPTDDPKASELEQFAKQQISFYMSTPSYRIVPEMHGWEATAIELSKMARAGEWADMPAKITDEMLSEFAVSGTWAELPNVVRNRYGDMIDRVSYYIPYVPGERDEAWRTTIEAFSAK